MIEYGNRILTGFVGIAVIAASVLAWFRRPFRWHLALFGAMLPLGVIGQAILGAPGRQVRPGAGARDVPLHPLDAAARRGLRACLVLALRARRAAPLDRPARRLGGSGADPARPADDPRRDDRDRLRARTPAPMQASSSTASTSRAPGRWNGWSSATRRSPRSSAWRRSPSGSSCAAQGGDRRAARPLTRGDRPARPPGRRSAASSGLWNCPRSWSGSTSRSRRSPGWRCSGRSPPPVASSRVRRPRRRAARPTGRRPPPSPAAEPG